MLSGYPNEPNLRYFIQLTITLKPFPKYKHFQVQFICFYKKCNFKKFSTSQIATE